MRKAFLVVLLGLSALVGVGFVCVERAVPAIEADLERQASEALPVSARDWASVAADGRTLRISGEAPSESARVEAVETLLALKGLRGVDDATVVSGLTIPASEAEEEPALAALCQREIDALLADERIHFEVLSAAITPASQPLLDRLVEALSQCPETSIVIAGHTDGEGIEELNLRLSEARAQSVRNSLIVQGVAANRLRAVGYGSSRPVADDATEAGRMENRRIEFTVKATKP